MSTQNLIEEALLPYEWPSSYFIGEEEIEAVTKVLPNSAVKPRLFKAGTIRRSLRRKLIRVRLGGIRSGVKP